MLASDDYLQVLTCIEAIHRCRTLADFPAHMLRALGPLIPNNLAAFNEVNLPRNRIIALTDRPQFDHARLTEVWQQYSAQHPVVRYVRETGDGQAAKISDFLSAREYHRLEIYREFYRPLQAEDQIAVTVSASSGWLVALAFNRAARTFSETDRVKLNLVRPHLVQAYANAEELEGHLEEKSDLESALRSVGHGLLAVRPDGKIAHATPGARACLAAYFPALASTAALPEGLVEWLRSAAAEPFIMGAATSRLVIRRVPHPGRQLLLLSEERDRPSSSRPPLTARESEVLRWLAEGKTNPEIALILGVASGTVKMHVERILAKLGVDNRTAATVLARESGLLSGSGERGAWS